MDSNVLPTHSKKFCSVFFMFCVEDIADVL